MKTENNKKSNKNKINKNNMLTKKIITKRDLGEDGIGHIRIGLNADTVLGNMLDNEYSLPFIHPYLGHFNSIEGFWNYITVFHDNKLVEEFRDIPGNKCQKFINELNERGGMYKIKSLTFKDHIYNAMYLKIVQNEFLLNMIVDSDLPFKQYFQIKKNNLGKSVLTLKNFQYGRSWILGHLENLRSYFKQNKDLIDRGVDSNNELFYYKEYLPVHIDNKDYNLIHERMKDYSGFYLKEEE